MPDLITKLIETAINECGYLEKASINNLDSKTGNAGIGNYTKYWQIIYPQYQGQPWCDCFVSWVFYTVYGKAGADNALCGGLYSFYTPTSAENYIRAGKWGKVPKLGSQIFFTNGSQIYHTGIVIGISNSTVYTVEGNTSGENAVVANGGGVWKKQYDIHNPKIAGYGYTQSEESNMALQIYTTPTKFVAEIRKVYLVAHNEHYKYGDSHATPPTADHFISCDRLIAKACWDLGWKDQPAGGITVFNMERYLLSWGWKKITDKSKLQPGDVVLFKVVGTTAPTTFWHTFVLVAYNPATEMCSKYDCGSDIRIAYDQPYVNVPLNQWPNKGPGLVQREFYCAFRCPQQPKFHTYKATVYRWTEGSKNNSVKLARTILKAEGYTATKSGVPLKISRIANKSLTYALRQFKLKNKIATDITTKKSKICAIATWRKLLGINVKVDSINKSMYTFEVQSWTTNSTSKSVRLAQKILRGLGYAGANGKALKMDGNAGPNTMYALKQFIKDHPTLTQTSETCGIKCWRKLLGLSVTTVK